MPPLDALEAFGKLRSHIDSVTVFEACVAAVKLKLADHLAKEPMSAASLAEQCGAHPGHLVRLLRYLHASNIFQENDEGLFSNSALSEHLRSDTRPTFYDWILFRDANPSRAAWASLTESVKTGEPAFLKATGHGLFEYLEKDRPFAETFHKAMANLPFDRSKALMEAFDLTSVKTFLDIGGGEGGILFPLLERHPHLEGWLFDFPAPLEQGRTRAKQFDLLDRVRFVEGNFFEEVPAGADVYFLSHIVHNWNDQDSVRILSECRKSMHEKSQLLIMDRVLPEPPATSTLRVSDLMMMTMTSGGVERTQAEFAGLLESSGLRLTQVIPTTISQSVVVAVKKGQ